MNWYAAGALSNEVGGIYYGKPGDQGGEVTRHRLNEGYWHGGKIIIMPSGLQQIAWCAAQICINQMFGYDQIERRKAFDLCKAVKWDPRKVTQKCGLDCSLLDAVALNSAGYNVPASMYTGDLEYWCKSFGAKVYDFDASRLRTGAILLKRWQRNGSWYGHTEVCIGTTPNPSRYVGKAQVIPGGRYEVAVTSLNVRSAPTVIGTWIAAYNRGDTVNLLKQTLIERDGYYWAQYVGYSGKTRYVAFAPVNRINDAPYLKLS